ncbi:hypothetical protein K443DRAFT_670995, partial [Laccaria amethystina LaAM-08-1]
MSTLLRFRPLTARSSVRPFTLNTHHQPDSAVSAQHAIYISNSTNPYFNLTLEDWLFRHKSPSDPLLLIYRDEPCVVIGRNQNPWKEVNFDALRWHPGVPFIRRRSGGGTVYHDLGNTNFSIHLPRTSFDRHLTAQIVLRAVRALGVATAALNERNDICVGADKVSGSAYKIVNKRAYHHGTMLISTRLDTLGDLLRPKDKDSMITRGVASVRSPVCNLQQYDTNITHEAFTAAVVNEFRKEYGVNEQPCIIHDTDDVKNVEYIRKGMAELPTWDWAYGQTPGFTHTINRAFPWGDVSAEIRAKHGVILDCSIKAVTSTSHGAVLEAFGQSFYIGKRYGFVENDEGAVNEVKQIADVKVWLRGAMS